MGDVSIRDPALSWEERIVLLESMIGLESVQNRYQTAVDVLTAAIAPKSKTSVDVNSPHYILIWNCLAGVVGKCPTSTKLVFKPSIVQSIGKCLTLPESPICNICVVMTRVLSTAQPVCSYESNMKLLLALLHFGDTKSVLKYASDVLTLLLTNLCTLTSARANHKHMLIVACKEYFKQFINILYKLNKRNRQLPLQHKLNEFLKLNLFGSSLSEMYDLAASEVGETAAPVKVMQTVGELYTEHEEDTDFGVFLVDTIVNMHFEAYGVRKSSVAFIFKLESHLNATHDWSVFCKCIELIATHNLYKPTWDLNSNVLNLLKEQFGKLVSEQENNKDLNEFLLQASRHFVGIDSRICEKHVQKLIELGVKIKYAETGGSDFVCAAVEVYSRQRQLDLIMKYVVNCLANSSKMTLTQEVRSELRDKFTKMPSGQVTNLVTNIILQIESLESYDSMPSMNLCVLLYELMHCVDVLNNPKLVAIVQLNVAPLLTKFNDVNNVSHCLLTLCVHTCVLLHYSYALNQDDVKEWTQLLESHNSCGRSLCDLSYLMCAQAIRITGKSLKKKAKSCLQSMDHMQNDTNNLELSLSWQHLLNVSWPAVISILDEKHAFTVAQLFANRMWEMPLLQTFVNNKIVWESVPMRKILVNTVLKSTDEFWRRLTISDPVPHKYISECLEKMSHLNMKEDSSPVIWREYLLKAIMKIQKHSNGAKLETENNTDQLFSLLEAIPFKYLGMDSKFASCACIILSTVASKLMRNDCQTENRLLIQCLSDKDLSRAWNKIDPEFVWALFTICGQDCKILAAFFDASRNWKDQSTSVAIAKLLLTKAQDISMKLHIRLDILFVLLDELNRMCGDREVIGVVQVLVLQCDAIIFNILLGSTHSNHNLFIDSLFDAVSALYRAKSSCSGVNSLRMDAALPQLIETAASLTYTTPQAVTFLSHMKTVKVSTPVLYSHPASLHSIFGGTCDNVQLHLATHILFASPVWVVSNIITQGLTFQGELLLWRCVLLHSTSHTLSEEWSSLAQQHLSPFVARVPEKLTVFPQQILHFTHLLVQNSCRKLLNDKLHNIVAMAFSIIAAVDLLDVKHATQFKSEFTYCMSILNDCFVQYRAVTVSMAATFVSILSLLISQITNFSKTCHTIEDNDSLSQCCFKLFKICGLIGQSRRDVERVVVYLVSDVIGAIGTGNWQHEHKRLLTNCLYKLMNLCDKYSMALISTNMPSTSLPLFSLIYKDYHKFHTYKGAV